MQKRNANTNSNKYDNTLNVTCLAYKAIRCWGDTAL